MIIRLVLCLDIMMCVCVILYILLFFSIIFGSLSHVFLQFSLTKQIRNKGNYSVLFKNKQGKHLYIQMDIV